MNAETLYRFFALPAHSVHESWLAFVPAELVAATRNSPLGTRALSRLLQQRAGLSAPDRFDLAAEHSWVLAEPVALLAAARRVGAAALGFAIGKCIQRDKVLRLRAALGDELHREALASPILLAESLQIENEAWSAAEPLRNLVERTGVVLMLATLPVDEPLRRRVALKFPEPYARYATPVLSLDDQRAVVAKLVAILQGASH